MNPDGSKLEYSTFIGDFNDDAGKGIAIDNSGGVYITGTTRNSTFATTFDGYEGNGNYDIFIIKIQIPKSKTTIIMIFSLLILVIGTISITMVFYKGIKHLIEQSQEIKGLLNALPSYIKNFHYKDALKNIKKLNQFPVKYLTPDEQDQIANTQAFCQYNLPFMEKLALILTNSQHL